MPDFDEQRREMNREIVMMVRQLGGWIEEYWYRGDTDTHGVVAQGTKCYGPAPKIHAFLSGMQVVDEHRQRTTTKEV